MYQNYNNPNNFINPFTNTTPQNYQQNNNNTQFIIKNVNNFDDAKNTQINPFNIFLFPDFNNSSIYLKRINSNGLEEMLTFKLAENPPDRLYMLEQKLANIENYLRGLNNATNDGNVIPTNVGDGSTAITPSISNVSTDDARQKSRGNKTNSN